MIKRPDIFEVLILVGRPASGKSEIIDYLGKLDCERRRSRFHLGELEIVDDFPMLWSWFEEDKILINMGKPRLYSTEGGYFKEPYFWDLLVRRLSLEYEKLRRSNAELHDTHTVIVEFSRGSEHGGYRRAFEELSQEVLKQAVVLYIDVSFEESLRKNRRRFNPSQPHSILEHSLPEEKMRKLYGEDDWGPLVSAESGFLNVNGQGLPYAVFENEQDITTAGGEALGSALQGCLDTLWQLRLQR